MPLPNTEEVNALIVHYQAIQKKLEEWKARDVPENAWLYDGARQDIAAAWKWVYRMGVRQQVLEPANPDDRTVVVCDMCKRASCWQGKFYCDDYKKSGVMSMTVGELRSLGRENEEYWNN